SCSSASSPATRKTSAASPSSAPPGAFSIGRWRMPEFRGPRFSHQRGEALQARNARQAAASQAAQRLRDRALQDLARYRTHHREAGGDRRPWRHRGAQPAGPRGHHQQGSRADLAPPRRDRRVRDNSPVVAAAHRGRGGQGTRVQKFCRRPAASGEDPGEKGRLNRRDERYSSSVKRPLTSAASASMTSAASRPLASTVMVVPGPAESIISPMIEVPPTTSWPRLTFTSASNFSTVCTNLAEARACNPFLLQILSTRLIGAWPGGSSAEDSPAASLICR